MCKISAKLRKSSEREDNMKKSRILPAVLMVGLLLAGCAGGSSTSTFSPNESSIFVARDGGIASGTVETYAKDIYVQSELEEFAKQATADYSLANPSGEGEAVTLKTCTLENGVAKLIFEYSSADALVGFAKEYQDNANQVDSLSVTTVADGLVQGLIVDASFVSAKDGKTVDSQTVTKEGKFHLVTVEGPAVTLQTEGKVQYISTGSTLVDEFTVKTPEGKSYIIFK